MGNVGLSAVHLEEVALCSPTHISFALCTALSVLCSLSACVPPLSVSLCSLSYCHTSCVPSATTAGPGHWDAVPPSGLPIHLLSSPPHCPRVFPPPPAVEFPGALPASLYAFFSLFLFVTPQCDSHWLLVSNHQSVVDCLMGVSPWAVFMIWGWSAFSTWGWIVLFRVTKSKCLSV